MRKLKILLLTLVILVVYYNQSPAQNKAVNRLRDVKTIYLDEASFNFSSSSCMKTYGNLKVVCAKHLAQRADFFVALKRWLGKYNFVLSVDRVSADAVLQGDLSIDDDIAGREFDKRINRRKKDANKDVENDPNESPSIFGPNNVLPGDSVWGVRGWLLNKNGDKLWTSPLGDFPGISYKSGKQSKIEGKRLARKLEYDFRRAK